MRSSITLISFFLLFIVLFVNASETLRGVNPKDIQRYRNDPFICDKNKKIPLNRVNDDYCDCQDASDEPGTNACNNGQFWCRNDDWVGNSILSSFVNDGICDCCDGSDEWQGKVTCKNTCIEKREQELVIKKEKLEKAKRGMIKREAYKEAAKLLEEKKKEEKSEIEGKLTEVTQKISDLEKKRTELEPKETIALEIKNLLQKDLSKPEEINQNNNENNNNNNNNNNEQEKKENDDGGPDDLDSVPKMTEEERSQKVLDLKSSLGHDDHESVIQEINSLRNDLSQLKIEESSLRQKEREISEYFSINFGPERVYAELYDKCFDYHTKEYVYQICFFKRVNQGGTCIGNWKEWKNKNVMIYEGGASCWNGPTRQTTVYLTCGETENFTFVNEPSKCIYEATFETPAACSQEDLGSEQIEFNSDIQI